MRVIIPLASGLEEIEAITLLDVLRRGGVAAVGVSIEDEAGLDIEGSHGLGLVADEMWDEADVDSADMIVLPGGLGGMQRLAADKRVLEALRRFDAAGKFVGAICAAPAVLQKAGVLAGRKAVCYPGMESHIEDAQVQKGVDVVRDGNIVTGRGPGAAMAFALAVLEMVAGAEARAKVAKGLLVE
ncbi:MAG: DJ-1 family glyoxalase III [Kiritimatiellia bacterium]|jgi:4-methyl-5(b-hydroxyethyl)-thiazole monophosphate biosynthesis